MDSGQLCVTPKIVYGDPVVAEISGDALVVFSNKRVPRRSAVAEAALARELQQTFSMKPGYEVRLAGEKAIQFIGKSKHWSHEGELAARIVDSAVWIEPLVEFNQGQLSVEIMINGRSVPFDRIASLRHSKERWMQVEGVGWFELSAEWMRDYNHWISHCQANLRSILACGSIILN
jgi:hypothetical protein